MRLALGFALVCGTLFAQPRQLATTDDGSLLYFSSYSRIYVYGPQGLHLFAQQDAEDLGWPSASGNAGIVAYSGASLSRLAFATGSVFRTGDGRASISRNGRFALFGSTVLDLGTFASYAAETGAPGAIASDGTAAIPALDSIQIVRPSGVTSYPTPGVVNAPAIDDKGAVVVYEAQGRIIRLYLATGEQTVAADPGLQPRLSKDGQTLLYLAPSADGTLQAWIGTRPITTQTEGIGEAVISGDGRIVYAASNYSRVFRVELASGKTADITAALEPATAAVAIATFANDPQYSPISGGPVTLTWNTLNAESVRMTGLGAPTGALPLAGSIVVHPVTNTTYTLFAYGADGRSTSTVLYVFVR